MRAESEVYYMQQSADSASRKSSVTQSKTAVLSVRQSRTNAFRLKDMLY